MKIFNPYNWFRGDENEEEVVAELIIHTAYPALEDDIESENDHALESENKFISLINGSKLATDESPYFPYYIIEFEKESDLIRMTVDCSEIVHNYKLCDEDFDDFKFPVYQTYLKGMAEDILNRIQSSEKYHFLFSKDQKIDKICKVHYNELINYEKIWFLGDVHGDLLSLECLLDFIFHESTSFEKTGIVFLGDLVDDGKYSEEVILRIWELMLKFPNQILVLAGNHDEALYLNENKAASSVSQSSYSDDVNLSNCELSLKIFSEFINFVKAMPRALFLEGGVFAAHGGFPLSDTWEGIKTWEDLSSEQCLTDFIWTRAHETAKRKIPNRESRGCEYGIKDMEGFRMKITSLTGGDSLNPVIMIRGHDHISDENGLRYLRYNRYNIPLVTINSMASKLAREFGTTLKRVPVIGCYKISNQHQGQVEFYAIDIPSSIISTVNRK